MCLTRAYMHVWLLPRPDGACRHFRRCGGCYVAYAPDTCWYARVAATTPSSWRLLVLYRCERPLVCG